MCACAVYKHALYADKINEYLLSHHLLHNLQWNFEKARWGQLMKFPYGLLWLSWLKFHCKSWMDTTVSPMLPTTLPLSFSTWLSLKEFLNRENWNFAVE